MKHLSFTILLFISFVSGNACAQSWMWAKNSSGTYAQTTVHHATDAWGNSYHIGSSHSTVGEPTNTVQIGSITLSGTETGYCFLAKYNALGTPLWVRKFVSADRCATDAAGNLFVTGRFTHHLTLGAHTVYSPDSTYSSNSVVYIAKFDSAGNALWLRSAGATGLSYNMVEGIATDALGNVAITGTFNNFINFGTTTLTNTPSAFAGQHDGFVAKYDASGNILWAKGIGGNQDDLPRGVAFDPTGNVIVAGTYTSDTTKAGSFMLPNLSNGYQLFLVKYSPTGAAIWAKSATGTTTDQITVDIRANGVATDAAGNIYFVGRTNAYTTNLSGFPLSNPSGWSQYLLVKYSAAGNCMWARITNFTDVCGGTLAVAIAVHETSVYSIGNTGAHSTHYLDMVPVTPGYFILKSDTSGHFISELSLPNPVTPIGIDHDNQGNTYISGAMNANCNIGPTSLTLTVLLNTIMAKYGWPPVTETPHLAANDIAQVYPNPSTGNINVVIPPAYTQASIVLSDITGRLVAQRDVTGNTGAPQQFTLPAGMYIVKVIAGEESYVSKFVVE